MSVYDWHLLAFAKYLTHPSLLELISVESSEDFETIFCERYLSRWIIMFIIIYHL